MISIKAVGNTKRTLTVLRAVQEIILKFKRELNFLATLKKRLKNDISSIFIVTSLSRL